ncbi:MAG: rhomboid family intramembrane serine protease [Sphingobacteriales bacterium]|nr:MAG: rhomboid family intramembrane serine protease [Sphingobacteriales bacterium]
MGQFVFLTTTLLVVTFLVSWQGLKQQYIIDKYAFNIEKVQINKEYIRFISSGFLHVNWLHLIINMFVLFSFGSGLEARLGVLPFAIIYFSSLTGGNLLALLIHKHNPHYTSVGASGAISGLIFASIAITPNLVIFFIPGWVFGLLYVLYTIYAIRSNRTDVGHAAHLGGALIGMVAAILLFPTFVNLIPTAAILLPGLILILIMIKKPELIMVNRKDQKKALSYEDRYNLNRHEQKKEVDRILEKIAAKGMSSLSKKERELLEQYSKS